MKKQEVLKNTSFGQRIAEDESKELAQYFVSTDQWERIFNGEIDIVYGPKGSGKSALYTALNIYKNELFEKNVLIVAAENPRGTPAFKELVSDPPSTETEIIVFWKLYFLMLIGFIFKDYGLENELSKKVLTYLSENKLLPQDFNLVSILKSAVAFARRILNAKSLETEVKLNPAGTVEGMVARISLSEPSVEDAQKGFVSLDGLMKLANEALAKEKYSLWILLDRLDVAFTDNTELEENALRALFKVYLDMGIFEHVRLKIFLRSDIWKRITKTGFREASHLTRALTIDWNKSKLLNLVVRRIVRNEDVIKYYDINVRELLEDYSKQNEFFYSFFPQKVEMGEKRPETWDWVLTRTMDGTGKFSPREIIHLLSEAKAEQIKKIEIGEPEPSGNQLISGTAIKDSLPEVSKVRFEQTLLAEYPQFSSLLLKMKKTKAQQTVQTLSKNWDLSEDEAEVKAEELVEVGFFEKRINKENKNIYFWVPFLYRDALNLVQGTAEVDD